MSDPTLPLNLAFLRLQKRAEQYDTDKLVETFVDAGPLVALLSTYDHQVIYGRRGTGKTHALQFLGESVRQRGDVPVFLDMRKTGSTLGVYGDESVPLPERGTRLLIDTLAALHEQLHLYVTSSADVSTAALEHLDQLADQLTQVRVVGSVEQETTTTGSESGERGFSAKLVIAPVPSATLEGGHKDTSSDARTTRTLHKGTARYSVHFGAVVRVLERFLAAIPARRVWILIDEWSVVPMELQPLLADLLRRSLLPIRGITVKIGAIEQRSRFRVSTGPSDTLGLELGADVAADVDLDDFMVFGNDSDKARRFFEQLLFKHVRSALGEDEANELGLTSPEKLVARGFTQGQAFEEFVRAAEGVPRDAINVISLAAQKASDQKISIPTVHTAARAWYQRDKEAAVNANPRAKQLLHWIIDKVIGERRARAFLLRQGVEHPLITALFDARVLHVVKRGVSSADSPGVRYNVYSLDYGCYVDLMTTAKAPEALFHVDDGEGGVARVEVPTDDYRSIRRAILDLDEFYATSEG